MATVTKDFRIKSGLVVEGTTGTINGSPILTEANIGSGNPLELVQDIVGGMVSTNTEDGISVEYDDTNGKLNFNVNDPTITISGDVDGNAVMTNLGDTNISVTLDTVNTAVGTYGSTTAIPSITVDGKGRVTNVTTNTISTGLGIAGDTGTDTVSLLTDTLTFEGGTGITSTVSNNKVTVDIDSTVATLSDQQTLTNKVLGTNVDLGANLDAATNKIINLGAPTQANDAATKAYVDATAEGLHVKPAVLAATTVDLGATYANGTNGVDATLTIPAIATLNIDGQTAWEVGDGILVKDQDDAFENGRYYVVTVGDAGTAWVLKRCIACDEADEIPSAYVFVQAGSTYVATGWVALVENPTTFTVGQDDITWEQFSGAGTYTAGTGLDLNGTEFVLDLSEVDTTTLPEGTNKYYTDERVDDRVANLVSGGTGITATYDDNGNLLTLSAEFTEFDTSDVVEDPAGTGTSGTLYFTNARAVTALEAVVPNFEEVRIDSLAKQVAAQVSAPTAATAVTAYAFAKASFRSAKFLVKVAYSTHTEISEVLLTLDTSDNIAITEYAVVGTNGSSSAISADIDGTNVRLRVTPVNASSTVTVMGTLLV
jgi:hypothetical protein